MDPPSVRALSLNRLAFCALRLYSTVGILRGLCALFVQYMHFETPPSHLAKKVHWLYLKNRDHGRHRTHATPQHGHPEVRGGRGAVEHGVIALRM